MNKNTLAIFTLENGLISSVVFYGKAFQKLTQMSRVNLLYKEPSAVFPDISAESEQGQFFFNGHWIQFTQIPLPEDKTLLLLHISRSSLDNDFFRFAMDMIDVGIQIYDKNSTLIFLNTASEKMSSVDRKKITGKKLLEIYDTDEQHSCVLATLNRRTSFFNQIDSFQVHDGSEVTVINTSIPYIDRYGSLEAVINLEYTQESIENLIKTTNTIKKITTTSSHIPDHVGYYTFDSIISRSPKMREAIEVAKSAVGKNFNVFITGETGTGKELIAQSIFSADPRKTHFVAINCSTIPEDLADAALFGTVKGAFTGSENSEGLFAVADGGTLFLDEVNSLALSTQARLLRILQEGRYMKVGSTKEISCNVRVIASCNQNPWDLMNDGKMRQDLFYRLAGVQVDIPPLREREEDIDLLISYYIDYYAKKFSKKIAGLSPAAKELLREYQWPGNVRELKNLIEFAVSSSTSEVVDVRYFPNYIRNMLHETEESRDTRDKEPDGRVIDLALQTALYERELIIDALERSGNNITKAAERLSISRQTLQHKLKRHKIDIT